MKKYKETLKQCLVRLGLYPLAHIVYSFYRNLKKSVVSAFFAFFPIQENKIVFDNFVGRGYGDNPKYIAEEIFKRNLPYAIVWLVRDMNADMPHGIQKVRYGSLAAFKELATAHMWISNVRNTEHPKKRKGQIYLQTWHGGGIPFKWIEGQAPNLSRDYIRAAREDGRICDAILASSAYVMNIMQNSFWINSRAEYLKFGAPKDDILYCPEQMREVAAKLRAYYRISEDVGVIIYLPTFRDKNDSGDYGLDFGRVIDVFEKKYQRDFVLMVRFHPNATHLADKIPDTDKIINATSYPEANELYSIADALITDYSAVIIPFSLLRKPVFRFTPDLEQYRRERGLAPIYDLLPCSLARNNGELERNILHFDRNQYDTEWANFREQFQSYEDGHAAEKTVDWIQSKLSGGCA